MVFAPNDNAVVVATIDDSNSGSRYAAELERYEQDREHDERLRTYGRLMHQRHGVCG